MTNLEDTLQVPHYEQELRLYSFCNFYLSSIQQGIQTGHAAVRMVRKYTANGNPLNSEITEEKIRMVEDWADNHETFIVLNGGTYRDLMNIWEVLLKSKYPHCVFYEECGAIDNDGGVLTCVSVILPDTIFNMRREKNIRGEVYYSWTRELEDGGCIIHLVDQDDPEFELIDMLKSKGLAK